MSLCAFRFLFGWGQEEPRPLSLFNFFFSSSLSFLLVYSSPFSRFRFILDFIVFIGNLPPLGSSFRPAEPAAIDTRAVSSRHYVSSAYLYLSPQFLFIFFFLLLFPVCFRCIISIDLRLFWNAPWGQIRNRMMCVLGCRLNIYTYIRQEPDRGGLVSMAPDLHVYPVVLFFLAAIRLRLYRL